MLTGFSCLFSMVNSPVSQLPLASHGLGPGGGRFGPELPGAAKGPGTTSGDFSNQDFLGWGLNDASIMVGIYICIYIICIYI